MLEGLSYLIEIEGDEGEEEKKTFNQDTVLEFEQGQPSEFFEEGGKSTIQPKEIKRGELCSNQFYPPFKSEIAKKNAFLSAKIVVIG